MLNHDVAWVNCYVIFLVCCFLSTPAELEDPCLKSLALQLPTTVLRSSADSTTNKYLYAYASWRKWADEYQVPHGLPVSEVYLVLYLQYLWDTMRIVSLLWRQLLMQSLGHTIWPVIPLFLAFQ